MELTIAREILRTNAQGALEIAARLPDSSSRNELLAQAGAQWASDAPNEAVDWALAIGDDALRAGILSAMTVAIGESNPAEAARLALEMIPRGRAQSDTLVGVVQRWAQIDPRAAAAWVERFPVGGVRDDAMDNLVKLWADQDVRAPGQWINSLAAGAARDGAIRAYAQHLAPSVPARAAAWAGTIADGNLRQVQLANIGELWMRQDPALAVAWIRQAPISSELKERLLKSAGCGIRE